MPDTADARAVDGLRKHAFEPHWERPESCKYCGKAPRADTHQPPFPQDVAWEPTAVFPLIFDGPGGLRFAEGIGKPVEGAPVPTGRIPVVPVPMDVTVIGHVEPSGHFVPEPIGLDASDICAECGGLMQRTGGCKTCRSCGSNTGCG